MVRRPGHQPERLAKGAPVPVASVEALVVRTMAAPAAV